MKKDRTGVENINNQGLSMKILTYRSNSDMDIIFEDGYISYNKEYKAFRLGNISNPNFDYCKKKNRLGQLFKLKCGSTAKIIRYKDANDLDIEIIETNEIFKNINYKNLKNGVVKSKLTPSVLSIGYLGYEPSCDDLGNQLQSYKTWFRMLTRCYDARYQERQPTYKGCKVCDEWLNYSNFKLWYDKNYYEIEGETMCLDKDILIKNNKIYSPETCVFVPKRINSLFVKNDSVRGDLPIGVSYHDDKNYTKKYTSTINKIKNREFLGYYLTKEEAFYSYKTAKESYIKQVAEEYKNKIPKVLYYAMYRYEVEIID